MRGGTSKALFFRPEDLPAEAAPRDQAILAASGSPDPYRRQLDGLGGAASSTSKVAVVGSPRPDQATDGQTLAAGNMDVLGRIVSVGRVHPSYALTGAIATVAAAVLPGPVVHRVASPAGRERGWVRLGHPAGVMAIGVEVAQAKGQWRGNRVSTTRTARRLMDGRVYVPRQLFAAVGTEPAMAGAEG